MNDSTRSARPALNFRGLTSMALTLSFVLMALSGAVLYAAPRGRDANWSGWTWLGLWRDRWVALHIVMAVVFLLFGAAHIWFNRRCLWCYVRSGSGAINLWKELLIAVGLVGGLALAATVALPPAEQLADGTERIKDHWSATLPRGPFPHAELLTLEEMSRRSGIAADELASALEKHGHEVGHPSQSLLDIARANDTTPAAVFEILRQEFPELNDLSRGRGGRGRGLGLGRSRIR